MLMICQIHQIFSISKFSHVRYIPNLFHVIYLVITQPCLLITQALWYKETLQGIITISVLESTDVTVNQFHH